MFGILFPARRTRPSPPGSLAYPDYPLEQRISSENPAAHAVLLAAVSRGPSARAETLCVGDHGGLRLLARTERALREAVRALVERCPARSLRVRRPSVRFVDAVPVLEPWMAVSLSAGRRHRPLVEANLHARGADVRKVTERRADFQLHGEAPLARMLGYEDWLSETAGRDARVELSLSRYRPRPDDGPAAA